MTIRIEREYKYGVRSVIVMDDRGSGYLAGYARRMAAGWKFFPESTMNTMETEESRAQILLEMEELLVPFDVADRLKS